MELKLDNTLKSLIDKKLLIVPYGIEMGYYSLNLYLLRLLIVPYGIEIDINLDFNQYDYMLLIVPYGIEIT